ncbi:MAG: hypothetical protein OXI57_10560 [Rhodospirillales bacterium]|nr:hypothetical protein [Rhodospirillales bacterium]
MRVSERLSRFAGVAIVGFALALGGCAGVMQTKQYGDESDMTQQPPAGAIQVGEDHYMVPAGADSDGCPLFRPWSGSKPVKTALYYQKADGSFTIGKEQSACVAG